MKKVSVCLSTYNGEKYIKEQIVSILNQLKENDEIIISDDGSTDNTLSIINDYQDKRIKIFHNKKHGITNNFENALKKAKGDYIFLCDQDDVWLENKVSLMSNYLTKYDLVVSDCKITDSDLNILSNSFFLLNKSKKGFWKNLYKNSYLGCCMAFRRETLNYILPFPTNIAMHDIWIGLCVELNGNCLFLDTPLIYYRRHGNNASSSSEKSKYPFYYKINYRLYFLYNLIIRFLKKHFFINENISYNSNLQ